MLARTKAWAGTLTRDVHAVWLAARHPGTPWYAKAAALAVAAYALSPIDLIPDFVPVLGYLDDLVIVPLGILLVRRLVPPAILAECRAEAEEAARQPRSGLGAALVVALWVSAAALLLWWLWPSAAP
ncbi:YkvA family protein [Falsiroseomonas oryziterrae]|uniref:YkvA family protein n=1 Tax=Falsiroseomonas oryziterrae TaxID=2911368 RepID=UPI001F344E3C|nr:DUF1232 domain-containing protein [Roseomonas sp. NPKOSM-4]